MIFSSGKRAAVVASALVLAQLASPERSAAAAPGFSSPAVAQLRSGFLSPPQPARPGVYWYFMDGNISREGMTRDLESMKEAGIGRVVFLEVNVGVPRGTVDFLSAQWLELFKHANSEAKRLGIEITLGVGPGWAGSGGPWVKPEDSMQQLVGASVEVDETSSTIKLPVPPPRDPYFSVGVFTPDLKRQWLEFYEDVAVIAYPTPANPGTLPHADEKALYYRPPYTSVKGVTPHLLVPVTTGTVAAAGSAIKVDAVVEVTKYLLPDGKLNWQPPAGRWTIVRLGRRNNGAITRPAPAPGLGFECDKMSTPALHANLEHFTGRIFDVVGSGDSKTSGGLTALHMDSWEMGAQNWTPGMREEFRVRRGYDPLPYFPAYLGQIVESAEVTERFLWDLRLTCQELVLENHAAELKRYSHQHGLEFSIEPYDMNPTSDLALGAVADIPMCEFWSRDMGFNSAFSCLEATSIGHVGGHPIVQAEAFTGAPEEGWQQYPGRMKNQGDWAFALGINRFFYHTFAHQPLPEELVPGMTMGPYGVHWDRKQTWWPMVGAYHEYIARCQYVLQQGTPVTDILYLVPEGAPQVFVPPPSSLAGDKVMPDKKGYGFDACEPGQLMSATVRDGKVVFPGGSEYRVLMLPLVKRMTPRLLGKIRELAEAGATIVGMQPVESQGLSGYPGSDEMVMKTAASIWGGEPAAQERINAVGKGTVISGGRWNQADGESLYPSYDLVAGLLKDRLMVAEDFASTAPLRYHHRRAEAWDVYFVSNTTSGPVDATASFRTARRYVQIWDPLTGEVRQAKGSIDVDAGITSVSLRFHGDESFFVVFADEEPAGAVKAIDDTTTLTVISAPWTLSFDPKLGGPTTFTMKSLSDLTTHEDEAVRHYSGIVTYRTSFLLNAIPTSDTRVFLNMGNVQNMARVRINGRDAGVAWSLPWQVEVTGLLQTGSNDLEIEVANLWINRLIGDLAREDDGVKGGHWPDWLKNGKHRPGNRVTFTTYNPYKPDSPLQPSGLVGPVSLQQSR